MEDITPWEIHVWNLVVRYCSKDVYLICDNTPGLSLGKSVFSASLFGT